MNTDYEVKGDDLPYRRYSQLPREIRLEAMLEATQAGTWEWNVRTGETRFNERWANIVGYSLDELQPVSIQTWWDIVHPDDAAISRQKLADHFSGKTDFYECELRVKHKNGNYSWVRDYGKLLSRTPEGDPEWIVGTHIDINHLIDLSLRFEAFSDLLPGMVYQYEEEAPGIGRFPYSSKGMERIYGVTPEQVRYNADPVFQAIHPDDLPIVASSIEESRKNLSDWVCEYRVSVHGEEKWVFGHARPRQNEDGTRTWFGMIVEITERKQLELELEKSQANLKLAQRIARVGHWRANLETRELFWSDMIYQMIGYTPKELSPSLENFHKLVHDDDFALVIDSEKRLRAGESHSVKHRLKHKDGHYIWVHELAELQPDGKTLIGTVRDITEEKQLESQLKEQATVDPLTHTYNRRYFNEFLQKVYSLYQRKKQPFALLAFDLDHFKYINDTYGHAAGDTVLSKVTDTIKEHLRESDIVARVGGEEFAIILTTTTETLAAKQVAEKLRAAVEATDIDFEDEAIHVTATFGLVVMNDKVQSKDHLQQIADRALYEGKNKGRNQVVVADSRCY